jgi:hypothetical protein
MRCFGIGSKVSAKENQSPVGATYPKTRHAMPGFIF